MHLSCGEGVIRHLGITPTVPPASRKVGWRYRVSDEDNE